MRTDLFDYELPVERIAQHPRPRGSSRLLTLDRESGAIAHRRFAELPELLRPGDLLVRNDVRVLPTRSMASGPAVCVAGLVTHFRRPRTGRPTKC